VIEKYLQHLTEKLDDKVLQLQEAIADGNAADFPSYKQMCGEIKGLLFARSYIKDLQERITNNDDDE
jgi:hypothetical protein